MLAFSSRFFLDQLPEQESWSSQRSSPSIKVDSSTESRDDIGISNILG